ncbi:hypothetical protein ACFW96_38575 [Streptomyces gardneri]|uniref:hypothetical protein n=1 Tax=Streptomyces gardneri TaxID=66892 RepID=UPI0036843548
MDLPELPGYEFGASGGLVSTPKDLNAFWDGCSQENGQQMFTTSGSTETHRGFEP